MPTNPGQPANPGQRQRTRVVSRVPVGGSAQGGAVAWPVRSGVVPTLVEGFTPRLESAHGISQALIPGATVAITPATTTRAAPGLPDWHASCGKTQLAAHVAETLWLAGEIELLAWVSATTRASVVSGLTAPAPAPLRLEPT